MDEELKRRWVDALRSGEYKQGDVFLKKGDRYCCLGVICELVDGANSEAFIEDDVNFFCNSFPSLAFLDKIGISEELATELSLMNDSGRSFEAIAKVIEERA